MKNIVLIIGARPNFMKALPVYEALKNDFNLTLIHTGQHFDEKMSKVFFEQLKFPHPDIHLTLDKRTKAGDFDDKLYQNNLEYLKNKDQVIKDLIEYQGELGQMGEIRDKLKKEFEHLKPDLVIVFGDVTSTLAAGLASKMLNIVIAHVESGLRSGDIKMPEEVNRILTDHITKYYFITEQSGVDNLKDREWEKKRRNVYLVGNTMIDTQKKYLQQALNTKYHETLVLKAKEYILITLHRPSNVDDINKLKEIFDDLEELSKTNKLVYPMHPRTKKNLKKWGYLEKVENNKNIILQEPLGYLEFTCLMANCKYIVTDSGGLQEETTALDIPCFTLRENTERPSTLIENHGTNQLIHKISEIKLKECKGTMDLWDGKSSERIYLYVWNIIKKEIIYEFRKKKHTYYTCFRPKDGMSKIACYKFCSSINIKVPEMIYYGFFNNFNLDTLEKKSFVIKINHGCNCEGIYVISYNNNKYHDAINNKYYNNFIEIKDLLLTYYKGKEVIIEKKLGEVNSAPVDIKFVCYNGEVRELHLQSRNIKNNREYMVYYVYSYTLNKVISSNYWATKIPQVLYTDNINEVRNNIDFNIIIHKGKTFAQSLLEKIEFNDFIRLDLYYCNNEFYLGEFTLTPGKVYFCDIYPKYLKSLLK